MVPRKIVDVAASIIKLNNRILTNVLACNEATQ
jgi:hypothetical protein